MTVRILEGDCRDVLRTLPDASVHCVVTSPPYYGLRDYGTATWAGGDPQCPHVSNNMRPDHSGHGAGFLGTRGHQSSTAAAATPMRARCTRCGALRIDRQLGLEETPEAYIANLVAVFSEVRRVLRDDGTLWLNIGDSYASRGGAGWQGKNGQRADPRFIDARNTVPMREQARTAFDGYKPKDLIGIPWMLAFALRADGWYLRQDIIWSKPNPMPESVTDRCTKAHEYLFLLTKSSRYYFDTEAIAEPLATASVARLAQDVESQTGSDRVPGKTNGAMKAVGGKGNRRTFHGGGVYTRGRSFDNDAEACNDSVGNEPNERGLRNKRSVWTIATQPFRDAHFATYPPALVEPCLLAGTSRIGCCKQCGAPWIRKPTASRPNFAGPTCRHGRTAPVPCTVLDLFFGAGTTGLVADRLQCDCIGIELKHDNVEMARARIHDDAPLLAQVSAA